MKKNDHKILILAACLAVFSAVLAPISAIAEVQPANPFVSPYAVTFTFPDGDSPDATKYRPTADDGIDECYDGGIKTADFTASTGLTSCSWATSSDFINFNQNFFDDGGSVPPYTKTVKVYYGCMDPSAPNYDSTHLTNTGPCESSPVTPTSTSPITATTTLSVSDTADAFEIAFVILCFFSASCFVLYKAVYRKK